MMYMCPLAAPAYRRQYFVLFFELVVILVALVVVSCLPRKRLAAVRHLLAHFFSMAFVLTCTALNIDITTNVWCGCSQAHPSSHFGKGAGSFPP